MKKIFNNKSGMTIVEIIISLALISLVLIFLFRLMNNLTKKEMTDVETYVNVSNSLIMKTIEKDFIAKELTEIDIYPTTTDVFNSNISVNPLFRFTFSDGSFKELSITDENLYYVNNDEQMKRKIAEGYFYDLTNITFVNQNDNDYGLLTINIPMTNTIKTSTIIIPYYYENNTFSIKVRGVTQAFPYNQAMTLTIE